jgi:hypothetical protein
MIKYSTKKSYYFSCLSLGAFFTAMTFSVGSVFFIKLFAGLAVLFFTVAIIVRREMKKHFWKSRIEKSEEELEAPYVFTWFWVSWVVFIIGSFIPLFLYGQDIISSDAIQRIYLGVFIFISIFTATTFGRYYKEIHKMKKDKNKEDKLIDDLRKGAPKA